MAAKNQITQINLFSPAIKHKKKALAFLTKLQFADFEREITRSHKIDPSLADVNSIKTVGAYLREQFENSRDIPGFLSKCWLDIPSAAFQNKLTDSEGHYTDRILAKIARQNLASGEEASAFVDPKEILHWGCLDLSVKKYEPAREKLLETLCSTHPLRADLWGYYGDVNILLKNETEANAAYLRALVLDPQKLDLFRLKHKALTNLHTRLAQNHTGREARSLLLIHGWLEGLIKIPRGGAWLAQQFKHLQDQLAQALPQNKQERERRFSICLYLDQSKPAGQIDYDAREQMMELDRELFRRYLGKL